MVKNSLVNVLLMKLIDFGGFGGFPGGGGGFFGGGGGGSRRGPGGFNFTFKHG